METGFIVAAVGIGVWLVLRALNEAASEAAELPDDVASDLANQAAGAASAVGDQASLASADAGGYLNQVGSATGNLFGAAAGAATGTGNFDLIETPLTFVNSMYDGLANFVSSYVPSAWAKAQSDAAATNSTDILPYL